MKKIKKVYKMQYRRLITLLSLVIILLIGVVVGGVFISKQLQPTVKTPIAIYEKQTSLRNEKVQSAAQITDLYFASGKKPPVEKVPIQTDRKIVALTFDDGPGYNSTQRILDTLDKYKIKATFFTLGQKVEENPEMLKEIYKRGHEVGNHSYDHPDLTTLTHDDMMTQITSTNKLIETSTKKRTTYLRPPYGAYNADIELSCGMEIILWNVDSNDWRFRDGPQTTNYIMQNLAQQSVILYHDIYETSADSVEQVIPLLLDQGYEFVTISEYLEIMGLD